MYQFGGITEADAPRIEAVFRDQGLKYRRVDPPIGAAGSKPGAKGTGIAYEVAGIDSTMHFQSVQKSIAAAAEDLRVDLPLERAVLVYGGLEARGAVATVVEVTVTPGARAWVADGDGKAVWREVKVDRKGIWKGPVNSKGFVQRNGGWLYIAANRSDFFRYSRVNVITGERETVSFNDFLKLGIDEPKLAPEKKKEPEKKEKVAEKGKK